MNIHIIPNSTIALYAMKYPLLACLLFVSVVLIRIAHNKDLRNRGSRGLREEVVKEYKILSAEEIKNKLEEFQRSYPHLVKVETSQDLYGLEAAGNEEDCPFDNVKGCLNRILTIENSRILGNKEALPEVFLSGAVHGDERVGPTSVMEASELLLKATQCELFTNSDDSCREELEAQGISSRTRQWLSRLTSSRRIIIIPTANALGYYREQRTEAGIDPNRDFPYDLQDDEECMLSIAARTINEVFREHIIQIAVTFHAGTEAIAYEWGATSFLNYLSPDNEAQKEICEAYSRYAGSFHNTRQYDVGTMNDIVYDVRGGMEDWAYGGSWDSKHVNTCDPDTYGGYPASKTTYNPSSLRMFNTLVEASNHKTPISLLGSSEDLFEKANGHVSRNIRLSLLMIDLVEPYVHIEGINQESSPFHIKPLQREFSVTYDKTPQITWSVGGAFTVDDTFVIYVNSNNYQDKVVKEYLTDHGSDEEDSALPDSYYTSESLSGVTKWNKDSGNDGTFSAELNISDFEVGDIVTVIAVAKVDQNWSSSPSHDKNPVNLPPQSHIVNVRTNPHWYFHDNERIVRGRLYWISNHVRLKIVPEVQTKG